MPQEAIERVAPLLVGAGADGVTLTAMRLLGGGRAACGGALGEALATGATRALRVRHQPGGLGVLEHARQAAWAIAGDPRAVALAIAVRLAHTRGASPSFGRESLLLWAPLSSLLGLGRLHQVFEDESFKAADRQGYDRAAEVVCLQRALREKALDEASAQLREALRRGGVDGGVSARVKHLWSVHRKLLSRGHEVVPSDLLGLRVIVREQASCFDALAAVHQAFLPVEGRFKDHITVPKASGYRSLHTTVVMPLLGEPRQVEVQIRTAQMHADAERGAASHARYKHGELALGGRSHIFALTPRGEVRRLPVGATPLDFAFAVHTDLGRGYVAARVDGRLVTVDTVLSDGQVVEIIASSRQRSSPGQLSWARAGRTRRKLRAALRASGQISRVDDR